MSGSGFNIKVKINSTNKILKDHGLEQDGRAIRFLRDEADRLMNPYIPMDNGMLRRNKTYPSNHEIKYISPYAKYQYYGKLMLAKNGSSWAKKGEKKVETSRNLKYHTSGTGPKWDKLMMQRRKNDLIKDVENYIKTGG
nr:MAG TPA: Minor capsid protein [Bacteriophage sp.]DAW32484.1 MAG TPA: Minor capsid protein [Caudoviricetes sp.]